MSFVSLLDNRQVCSLLKRIFPVSALLHKSTQYDTLPVHFNFSIGQTYNAFIVQCFSSSIRRSANAKPKCNFSLSSFSFSDITLYFIKSFNDVYAFPFLVHLQQQLYGCFAIIYPIANSPHKAYKYCHYYYQCLLDNAGSQPLGNVVSTITYIVGLRWIAKSGELSQKYI